MNKKNKSGLDSAFAMGVGVAAASVAAYLLFGPEGKDNRKVARGWVVKMKGEIIEKLEEMKHITEPAYNQIVDKVSARYAKVKNIDKKELEAIITDVRKHWKVIAKGAKSKTKKK